MLGYSDTSPQHADLDDDRRLSSQDGSCLSGGEADFGKEDDGDQDGDTQSDDVLRDETEFGKDDDDDQEEVCSEDALRETSPDPKGQYLDGDYTAYSPINEVHDEEGRLPTDSPTRQQSKSALDGISHLTHFSVPCLISTFSSSFVLVLFSSIVVYFIIIIFPFFFFFFLKVLVGIPK